MCLSCGGGGTTINNGQCQCSIEGYLKQDFNAKSFSCEACPAGSFKGPLSIPIYECVPCQGEGKIYDKNVGEGEAWKCVCDQSRNF